MDSPAPIADAPGIGAACDRCGADLLGADVRYLAEIKMWAAYDPIEIGSLRKLDRRKLHAEYVDALIDAATQSPEEAQASVYWLRRYDLCARCRKDLQADPLGRGGADQGSEDPGEPDGHA